MAIALGVSSGALATIILLEAGLYWTGMMVSLSLITVALAGVLVGRSMSGGYHRNYEDY